MVFPMNIRVQHGTEQTINENEQKIMLFDSFYLFRMRYYYDSSLC